jgi:putative Mg2+ transporter-C (MgtC) family protein
MLGLSEIAIRLVFSVIVGGLIGLEREVVHKPAGMRTHMLVCMGSALFVIIALEAFPNEVPRIIAGIATGIGFLGAGTIFKAKDDVHGLTTAASIWAVAAVGLAIGLGYYAIMLIAFILILIVLQLHKLNIFRNL